MEIIREGKVHFVKLPEGAYDISFKDKMIHYCLLGSHGQECFIFRVDGKIKEFEGNWTILGKAFELTEEQKKVVYDLLDPPVSKSFNIQYSALLTKHRITKDYIVITDK